MGRRVHMLLDSFAIKIINPKTPFIYALLPFLVRCASRIPWRPRSGILSEKPPRPPPYEDLKASSFSVYSEEITSAMSASSLSPFCSASTAVPSMEKC